MTNARDVTQAHIDRVQELLNTFAGDWMGWARK